MDSDLIDLGTPGIWEIFYENDSALFMYSITYFLPALGLRCSRLSVMAQFFSSSCMLVSLVDHRL